MSGEGELGAIRARYEDVCAELNMDEQTAQKAWSSYKDINNDYVLEVSQAPLGGRGHSPESWPSQCRSLRDV